MLNAWPCIGPGTAEREAEACCSCLGVVSHEAGSPRTFAGSLSFARVTLQDRGRCMLALDPASYPDKTSDVRTQACSPAAWR